MGSLEDEQARSFAITEHAHPAQLGTHDLALVWWSTTDCPGGDCAIARTTEQPFFDSQNDTQIGSALIRGNASPAPEFNQEPATSVLLLSGLAMVGLAKRKRTGGKRRSSRL